MYLDLIIAKSLSIACGEDLQPKILKSVVLQR
jgi:hypothetical protein